MAANKCRSMISTIAAADPIRAVKSTIVRVISPSVHSGQVLRRQNVIATICC
jgi:hypothetical protein